MNPLRIYINDINASAFFVYEGDLDGNGTDEFGVRSDSNIKGYRYYYVFTYKDGTWMYLIPRIWIEYAHFYEDLHGGQDAVTPSKRKGYVKVRYWEFIDYENCIIDTVINAKPLNLDEIYCIEQS